MQTELLRHLFAGQSLGRHQGLFETSSDGVRKFQAQIRITQEFPEAIIHHAADERLQLFRREIRQFHRAGFLFRCYDSRVTIINAVVILVVNLSHANDHAESSPS